MAYGISELKLGALLVVFVLLHIVSTIDCHPEADYHEVEGV